LSGTFNLVELVDNQHYAGSWNLFLMPLGAAIFLIAMVAEVERIPFDMPEAEAELVEGWWTEYGGMRWGLMFSAEYMRTYAACFLFTHFFLGGWHAPFQGVIGSIPILGTGYLLIPGIIWTLLKAWAVFVIFAWLRAALPRIRTDQILEFGWRYLLPLSIVQLVITVVMRLYLFDAENLRFNDRGGFAWDGGIGLFLVVPIIVTFIFSVLFVLYSLDEEPGEMVERPFHAQTLEPAGTHKAGE
jgi:NADH-quinone oxidoreductase subunit H